MPSTYQLFCRPCHVALEMVPGESQDSLCPNCRIRLPGDVVGKILEVDRRRRKLNAEAERQGLQFGQRGEVRMTQHDVPDHVLNLVLVIKVPDDMGP